MILRDYSCESCSMRYEIALPSMTSDDPLCPDCSGALSRQLSGVKIGGAASASISRENMPKSWNAAGKGDKSTVDAWRKEAIKRDKLEERHPELAGDRRPVLAHEGFFADKPLRAGDPLPGGTPLAPKKSSAQ